MPTTVNINTKRNKLMGRVMNDPVNNPKHYNSHPSGIECIQITEHMNFCLGNAVKYIWRAGLKGGAIEDLEKSVWYLQREIQRRKTYNWRESCETAKTLSRERNSRA